MFDNAKAQDFIVKFINEFKKEYPTVIIDFAYDDELDIFDIWHDSYDFQFKDQRFLSKVGILIKDILYANEIFNISFGYDYLRLSKNEVKNYVFQKNTYSTDVPMFTPKHSDLLKFFSYSTSVNVDELCLADVIKNTTVNYIQKDLPSISNNICYDENAKLYENIWPINNNCNKLEERLAS